MKIITGYTGTSHITAADDAALQRGIFGLQKYVTADGNMLAHQLMGNNTIRIKSGSIIYNGVHARIEDYEDISYSNGTQGANRVDKLVARYAKNATTGVESVTLVMLEGTANMPAQPLATDFLLYSLQFSGVNVTYVKREFEYVKTLKGLEETITLTRTQLTELINSTVQASSSNLSNQINTLNNRLNSEISTRQGNVNTLTTRIATEEAARANGDTDVRTWANATFVKKAQGSQAT